jgi:hypothetical protein
VRKALPAVDPDFPTDWLIAFSRLFSITAYLANGSNALLSLDRLLELLQLITHHRLDILIRITRPMSRLPYAHQRAFLWHLAAYRGRSGAGAGVQGQRLAQRPSA